MIFSVFVVALLAAVVIAVEFTHRRSQLFRGPGEARDRDTERARQDLRASGSR
jgi:hypothetical protein